MTLKALYFSTLGYMFLNLNHEMFKVKVMISQERFNCEIILIIWLENA